MKWNIYLSLNIFEHSCDVLDSSMGGAYGIEKFSLNSFFKIQMREVFNAQGQMFYGIVRVLRAIRYDLGIMRRKTGLLC